MTEWVERWHHVEECRRIVAVGGRAEGAVKLYPRSLEQAVGWMVDESAERLLFLLSAEVEGGLQIVANLSADVLGEDPGSIGSASCAACREGCPGVAVVILAIDLGEGRVEGAGHCGVSVVDEPRDFQRACPIMPLARRP